METLALMIAQYIGELLTVFFITFILFCAVMELRSVRDAGKLHDAPFIFRLFAYLTLGIGFLFDAMLNLLLSPILLEMPQEWLTTYRVARLKKNGNRWQRSVATWMCNQLSRIDINHCGE